MKNLERLKQAILALDADTTEAFEAFQVVSAQTADLLAALRRIADGWLLDAEEMALIARAAIARAEGGE